LARIQRIQSIQGHFPDDDYGRRLKSAALKFRVPGDIAELNLKSRHCRRSSGKVDDAADLSALLRKAKTRGKGNDLVLLSRNSRDPSRCAEYLQCTAHKNAEYLSSFSRVTFAFFTLRPRRAARVGRRTHAPGITRSLANFCSEPRKQFRKGDRSSLLRRFNR